MAGPILPIVASCPGNLEAIQCSARLDMAGELGRQIIGNDKKTAGRAREDEVARRLISCANAGTKHLDPVQKVTSSGLLKWGPLIAGQIARAFLCLIPYAGCRVVLAVDKGRRMMELRGRSLPMWTTDFAVNSNATPSAE